MISKLEKERVLYDSLKEKTSDKDSIIAFHDYFSFISEEGIELCVHLGDSIKERMEDKKMLDDLYKEMVDAVEKNIADMSIFFKKKKLDLDPILEDRMKDLRSLVNNTTHIFGGERLDSIYSEMSDITRRLQELGFEEELCKYVETDSNSKPIAGDIIALKNRKQYLTEKNNFNKKDARSLAGVLIRLGNLYVNIHESENVFKNSINIETFFKDLHERNRNNEYEKLISGVISESKFFGRHNYISDVDRLHQSIIINNQETNTKKEQVGTIFFIENGDIYHYQIGKLDYRKRGLGGDPKYIKMFKNIITYMPTDKNKIRVKEFESKISNNDKVGENYRINIGKNAKSFNKFLKKNGVQNVHPIRKEEIITATDEYITFHNIL